ncbi:MAG: hypothetical protein EYC69_08695 [Bacteroidetes bacterium]|nr:MAG: hypothetical protein EYC69_08695 [Bacteroidota bacterium]
MKQLFFGTLRNLMLLSLLLVLHTKDAHSVSGVSVANGNWNNTSTWSFNGVNRLPICGDTVTIPSGKVVTVTAQTDFTSCNSRLYIVVGGTFQFNNGNKLQLPCQSQVRILSGGVVKKATAGGGNSTNIEICATIEWKAGDGDLLGPALLGQYTLPISLVYFNAKATDDAVNLSWLTSSEINNDYFTIERSTDGINYDSILMQTGAGNSSSSIYYSVIDLNPFQSLSYYRLKQTDFDGKYSYSSPVALSFSNANNFELLSVNSANSLLSVWLNDPQGGRRAVTITQIDGHFAEKSFVNTQRGMSSYTIDAFYLAAGVYTIQIQTEHILASRKFIRN